MSYLGIDTSNYTTSAALYDERSGAVLQQKKLLPVKDGALGLRQSDAVFSHVKQLGELLEALFLEAGRPALSGIGVSVRPRDVEGSYMPCFLAGELAARAVGAAQGLTPVRVSHQAGQLAAALYSAGRLDLIGRRFAAFHLSGGTTECLLVEPDGELPFRVTLLAKSLDLKAGQAVDRVGNMLGLPFPAGPRLDELARQSRARRRVKPVFKGADCSLSGVENRCRRMLAEGEAPCDVARYCLDYLTAVVDGMTAHVREDYGELPILYAGGVMCNSLIRAAILGKYRDCYFAEPQFSADNAAGVAVLASLSRAGGAAC